MSSGTMYFKTLVSGADLSANVGFGVKISSATWVLGTDNAAQGVLVNGGAASGDECTVARGYVPHCVAGAAIAAGDRISCAADGKWETAVSTDIPHGIALSAATADLDSFEADITGATDEALA